VTQGPDIANATSPLPSSEPPKHVQSLIDKYFIVSLFEDQGVNVIICYSCA